MLKLQFSPLLLEYVVTCGQNGKGRGRGLTERRTDEQTNGAVLMGALLGCKQA
jgi:hypothetical protein